MLFVLTLYTVLFLERSHKLLINFEIDMEYLKGIKFLMPSIVICGFLRQNRHTFSNFFYIYLNSNNFLFQGTLILKDWSFKLI